MKNYLVMTSINPPTLAVKKYAAMKEWKVIMIGDKKSPEDWKEKNVTYLSPEDQEKLALNLVKKQPWNAPSRANVGFLKAMEEKPEFITQSDDDNIPNEYWEIPKFSGLFDTLFFEGFVNIYKYFTEEFVWPRGFPLDKILQNIKPEESKKEMKIGVWQHLADKDTDVDAIYRLTNNKEIYFKRRSPVVLDTGAMSPFNCQSTTFHKDVFLLLYLPVSITPRASDIVRGLVAQPILWHYGYSLGFTSPTVVQERNPHNYLRDFKEETLIYLHSEEIIRETKEALQKGKTMSQNLFLAYEKLVGKGLIPSEELEALRAWIEDVEKITKNV